MNTPKIRFKGFTDAWEQRKLESLCDVFMDGDWIEAKDQSNAGIRLVQTGNVGTTKYLNKENNQKWISEETFERLHCKEIYSGDILISRLPEPAGRACIVPELGTRMITAVDCTIVRTAKEYDSKYLVQYLSTTMYFKIVNSFLGGGTRQRISRGNLSGIDIPVPGSLDEQKKIGEYFSKLDHLITLHQRKCDETKQLKKFMLQKMFPKNGEKNPEIRFEGFTDDWEQRKLGEVSSKITKKNQDIVVDEVFTNSAEYGIISQRDFFDKDIANFENIDGYYIVEPNDFVYNPRISTTAPFGPIKRNKLERTGAMSPLYYVFRPHDIDLSYLECFFQTSCWHTFMRFNGNTGARSDRFAITDKVFDEMPISMPQDIEEQQKIGSYFSSLDNLITLHQRKCEKLKELKKFMLQNMFV